MKKSLAFVGLTALVLSVYWIRVGFSPYSTNALGLNEARDNPTYLPSKNCTWIWRNFLGGELGIYEQQCQNPWFTLSESSENKIIGSSNRNPEYTISIELLSKEASTEPLEEVKSWYEKLAPEQKENCEIKRMTPVAHKVRYTISVREEVLSGITQNLTELPGKKQYDYLCGLVVGAPLTSHQPYFEFDERSVEKYIFVSSYGQDEPPIDFETIRF